MQIIKLHGSFVFSQLLSKPKFSGVEKIKTIGSTYMAATGLNAMPSQEHSQVHQSSIQLLGIVLQILSGNSGIYSSVY